MKVFTCTSPNIRILVKKEDTVYDPKKGGIITREQARYAKFKNGQLRLDDGDKDAIEALRNHKDFNVAIREVDVKTLKDEDKKSKKTKSSGGGSESDTDGKKYTRGMSTAK